MDFKNLNGVFGIDFLIFVLVSVVFSLNFSLCLIFRCIKPI